MLMPVVLYVIFGFLVLTTTARINITSPIVVVGNTRYLGTYNANFSTNEYYGIRFAQAPTGSLRWKAPKPILPSGSYSTIINTTRAGPSCVQGFPYWMNPTATIPPGSEDCLLLNVFQPANAAKNAKLPVMATIHGGGYTLGDANIADPHAMMRHSNNAFVFVSVQYRLGAYGFMGSKRFVEDGGVANVGLLDQRLALEWVQQNIEAFGGDPGKITVVGGSAGGGSVTAQMIMYGGAKNPPFRAAVAEFPFWQQNLKDEQLERQYLYLLEATNCSSKPCLQALSEDALALGTQATYGNAYADGAYGYGSYYYAPHVDGHAIRDLPSREFQAGHFTKVPTWVDHDMYEGYSFANLSLTTFDEEMRDLRIQFPYASEQFVGQLFELYPSQDFNSTFWQRATWYGDFSINCPTYYIASSLSSYNIPVYKLVFNAGAQTHAAVGPFLVDPETLPIPAPGYNATLADVMKDWYISFAVHNDPNTQSWSVVEKPRWPVYADGEDIMTVNYTEIGVVRDDYYDKTERCDFMWDNAEVVQN